MLLVVTLALLVTFLENVTSLLKTNLFVNLAISQDSCT